jgi:hypothetical protein
MRPKYVVIQLWPNMLSVADIDIFENAADMSELLGSQETR